MKLKILPFATSVAALAIVVLIAQQSLVAFGAEQTSSMAAPSSAPSASASAAPPTNPASFSIHGQVNAGGSLELYKIDLTRVVVYLESDPALDAVPIPSEHASVAQKNKQFVPKFTVVPKGTIVEFPNWDHIYHNVFSRSAAAPAFDLDRYPYGQSKSRAFTKVGVVQIFCNIHPYMRAIVFVTPNVFFARAAKDGQFQIDHVPAGHYQISVWQERCKPLHQNVDAGPGNDQPLTFNLEEDRDAIMANDPPKHGDSYGIERGLGVKQQQLNLPVVRDSHPAPTTEPCANCN